MNNLSGNNKKKLKYFQHDLKQEFQFFKKITIHELNN